MGGFIGSGAWYAKTVCGNLDSHFQPSLIFDVPHTVLKDEGSNAGTWHDRPVSGTMMRE